MRTRYQELAEEVLKLYPAANDEQARIAQNESSWDQSRVSTYLWAMARAKTAKTAVYTYFWDHTLPGPDADKYGAFHTSEVPYVLNTLNMSDRPFTDTDRTIAETLSTYWVNFAATGNPNGKGLTHWPSVSEKPAYTMELGDKMGAIPVAGSPAKLKLLQEFFAKPRPPLPVI
jgi:carboxylesterase type B